MSPSGTDSEDGDRVKQDPENIGPPCKCHGVPTRIVNHRGRRYQRCRVKMAANQRKHQATEKGIATHRRYRQTEKFKVNNLRYHHSPKGELRTARYRRKTRLPKERERIAEEIRRLEEEQNG